MKQSILKALGLGFVIAFSVGGFTLLGYFIDSKINTQPIFTIVGALFGVFNAFYYLWNWTKE
jgi:F0F1-type ATP synthase assembly protein I